MNVLTYSMDHWNEVKSIVHMRRDVSLKSLKTSLNNSLHHVNVSMSFMVGWNEIKFLDFSRKNLLTSLNNPLLHANASTNSMNYWNEIKPIVHMRRRLLIKESYHFFELFLARSECIDIFNETLKWMIHDFSRQSLLTILNNILHHVNASTYLMDSLSGWLIVGLKTHCLTRDLGQWVVCPPWRFF